MPKDSGWYVFGRFNNSHRAKDDLVSRSAIVIDMEVKKLGADVDAALEELKQRLHGYRALYYTTYHYDAEIGEKRYRVVIPLAEDITAEEYEAATAALIDGLDGSVDPCSVSPVQCSYLPTVSHDEAFYGCWLMPGDRFYSLDDIATNPVLAQKTGTEPQLIIREGQRNNHMSACALRVLKRYGDKDTGAQEQFLDEAKKCYPPLSGQEIQSIWDYALAAYQKKVLADPDYIMPELYGRTLLDPKQVPEALFVEPFDFTSVGLSNLFARGFKERIRFSNALGWIVWDGKVWRISDLTAQEAMKDLTALMLDDANNKLRRACMLLGEAKASGSDRDVAVAKEKVRAADAYQKFALRMREANKIQGALKLARSAMEIKIEECDSNPYLLNTPGGIVDLNSGEIKPHDPAEYCTKITKYAPADTAHSELWDGFLDTITQGDKELQRYIQAVIGAALIGTVYTESIVIAYGSGANGKSTLFNAFHSVLGSYAGKVPAEALTTSRNASHKNTLAELLGRRFVIASETEEGQRFSNSMLKQMASTDPIVAEKKYKDPFEFMPSHQLVLYTNFLPKVSGNDHGTWRRLVVVPFNTTITNPQTNFLERLLEQSGGVILRWMIDGAKTYIDAGRKFPPCGAVEDAIRKYKEDNDWLSQFLDENCEIGDTLSERAGVLYDHYHQWAKQTSNYARGKADFNTALEERGFDRHKDKQGAHWFGLRLREEHNGRAAGDGR
jgi:P4 family phage/plasmid primase-like protien